MAELNRKYELHIVDGDTLDLLESIEIPGDVSIDQVDDLDAPMVRQEVCEHIKAAIEAAELDYERSN